MRRQAALRQNIMDLKLEHLYSKALPIVTISQGISYGVPEERKQELGFSTYCRYAVISGKEEKQK